MPETGTTALVISLPAAEGILYAARQINPDLVRPGVVAHVTALYPFLPAAELTGTAEQEVRDLAAEHSPGDVVLTEILTAPGFAAAPAPALQDLADAACARWPHLRPYGGRFGPRPAAHLTVALGGTDDELARIAGEVRSLLPVHHRAETLDLVELTENGWRLRLTAPFGPAAGTTAR
ncbi:2'-5' RNA ligase family protein [Amycolatopsis lurida]